MTVRASPHSSKRRRWLLGLALLVATGHAVVVTEFGARLRGVAPAGSIRSMDVAFVHTLEAKDPVPVSAGASPSTESAAAPTAPAGTMMAAVVTAASTPDVEPPPKKPRRRPKRPVEPAPRPSPAAKASERAPPEPPPESRPESPLSSRAVDEDEAVASSPKRPEPPAPEATEPSPTPSPDTSTAASSAPAAKPSASAAPTQDAAPTTPGVAFDWPPSTQLRYVLKGYYRGDVEGSAKVQWVRMGSRYQVLLEVAVGPSFAPLMSRQMISEGDLGADGLVPRRYEERTRIGLSARQLAMSFGDGQAVLANGTSVPSPQGIQDASSQFVQLTYLFTTNPSLLRAGQSVNLPVALPRRVNTWIYDIVGEEALPTPIGELKTFHVRPRRESPRPGELVAQAWYAPALQYLPVRILIHQDVDTWIDMQIESAPLQVEPSR